MSLDRRVNFNFGMEYYAFLHIEYPPQLICGGPDPTSYPGQLASVLTSGSERPFSEPSASVEFSARHVSALSSPPSCRQLCSNPVGNSDQWANKGSFLHPDPRRPV